MVMHQRMVNVVSTKRHAMERPQNARNKDKAEETAAKEPNMHKLVEHAHETTKEAYEKNYIIHCTEHMRLGNPHHSRKRHEYQCRVHRQHCKRQIALVAYKVLHAGDCPKPVVLAWRRDGFLAFDFRAI